MFDTLLARSALAPFLVAARFCRTLFECDVCCPTPVPAWSGLSQYVDAFPSRRCSERPSSVTVHAPGPYSPCYCVLPWSVVMRPSPVN